MKYTVNNYGTFLYGDTKKKPTKNPKSKKACILTKFRLFWECKDSLIIENYYCNSPYNTLKWKKLIISIGAEKALHRCFFIKNDSYLR